MWFKRTECCAISEICALSTHTNAEEAMVSFCQDQLISGVRYGKFSGYKETLSTFYLFTAAVYSDAVYTELSGIKKYGHEFADFILKNKLGSIIESPALSNNAFHPDHKGQVWLWMPDTNAIRAWWEAYKTKIYGKKVDGV